MADSALRFHVNYLMPNIFLAFPSLCTLMALATTTDTHAVLLCCPVLHFPLNTLHPLVVMHVVEAGRPQWEERMTPLTLVRHLCTQTNVPLFLSATWMRWSSSSTWQSVTKKPISFPGRMSIYGHEASLASLHKTCSQLSHSTIRVCVVKIATWKHNLTHFNPRPRLLSVVEGFHLEIIWQK